MRLLAGAVLALSYACGGAPPRPANHSDFDAIQRQEARLEANAHVVNEDPECSAQCPAAAAGCDSAARICEISERVDDRDAAARCADAQHRCEALRSSVQRCGC